MSEVKRSEAILNSAFWILHSEFCIRVALFRAPHLYASQLARFYTIAFYITNLIILYFLDSYLSRLLLLNTILATYFTKEKSREVAVLLVLHPDGFIYFLKHSAKMRGGLF